MNSSRLPAATPPPPADKKAPLQKPPTPPEGPEFVGVSPTDVGLPEEEELEARARGFFAAWGVLDRLAHVEVVWNSRLRTTAARAHPRRIQIQLNPNLLSNALDRVDEVLAHEAAHLATCLLHGSGVRPHGPEWSSLMAAVGHRARATHDLDVGGSRPGYYLHLCAGCGARRITTRRRERRHCACSPGQIAVYRASRSAAGRDALARFSPG